jgi:hypothetical protein
MPPSGRRTSTASTLSSVSARRSVSMIDITDWPPPPPKAAKGFCDVLVGQAAAQVQLQHRVGGNRGGARRRWPP